MQIDWKYSRRVDMKQLTFQTHLYTKGLNLTMTTIPLPDYSNESISNADIDNALVSKAAGHESNWDEHVLAVLDTISPIYDAGDIDDELDEDVPPKGITCVTSVFDGAVCGKQATHYGIGFKPFCEIHAYEDESVDDYEPVEDV